MTKISKTSIAILIFFLFKVGSISAKDIPIGHLVDFTGPTSSVGKTFWRRVY